MPTPTTAPWDHLYNDIKIAIPGMTDAVLKQVLFQVVKDFTDKTNAWYEDIPIPVEPNVFTYQFAPADKGIPNRVLLLYDPAVGANTEKHWASTRVEMPRPGILTVGYSPSDPATWGLIVAKTPIDPPTTDKFPDLGAGIWIVDKYRDGLMAGVLGRAMAMPAKPFTNPALAKMYYQNYIAERGKARSDVAKGNVLGGQRWIYPQGWATYRRGGWA